MRRIVTSILERFPPINALTPVYSIGLSFLNAWMLIHFFWKFPGWIKFLSVAEIATVLSYSFATTLLESLALIIGLAILAALLPRTWLYDMFVARGTALVLLGLGYVVYFAFLFQSKTDYPADAVKLIPLVAAAIGGVAYFAGRISLTRRALEVLADRFLVFLYVFFPLGFLGFLITVMRNLW